MILISQTIDQRSTFYGINPDHVVNFFFCHDQNPTPLEGTDKSTIEVELTVNLTNGVAYHLKRKEVIKYFIHSMLSRNGGYDYIREDQKMEKDIDIFLESAKKAIWKEYLEKPIEIDPFFFRTQDP